MRSDESRLVPSTYHSLVVGKENKHSTLCEYMILYNMIIIMIIVLGMPLLCVI